jgi:hypothetical protein
MSEYIKQVLTEAIAKLERDVSWTNEIILETKINIEMHEANVKNWDAKLTELKRELDKHDAPVEA